jgi:prepilin peptidase CpaA
MIAEFLVLVALPALLAIAAGWDLVSFTIPNRLQLALLAVFALFVAVSGMTVPALGWHLLAGLVGLAVGFGLFAAGWIGGGDAKLFAAMSLWLGFHDLVPYALLASVAGGALTLALLAMRHRPLPAFLLRYSWVLRLHDRKAGIPYGVALAAGAFVLLPQTEIFRLAAGA